MDKNKIKFDHFNNIKELIQHLEMWYAEDDYFAYDRWFHLDDARKMGIYVYEQYKEIERLNNIIKEAIEYIETIVKNTPSSTRKDYANMILIDYKKVLEILKKEDKE